MGLHYALFHSSITFSAFQLFASEQFLSYAQVTNSTARAGLWSFFLVQPGAGTGFMPLAEAITLRPIWPHGQVVLQGDGRLQACQPVAAFSPGMPSTNYSRTTCPSICKSPSYDLGCSHLVAASWMLQAHGKGWSSAIIWLWQWSSGGEAHLVQDDPADIREAPPRGHLSPLKARVDLFEECSVCRLWSEMMSYTMLLFNRDFICVFSCFGHVC